MNAASAAPHVRVLQIMWVAFLVAVFVYAAVPALVLEGRRPLDASVAGVLPAVLWAAAGGLAVASFAVRRRIAGAFDAASPPVPAPIPGPDLFAKLRSGCIVTWTLSEAVALLGLVLALLGGRPVDYLPLTAAALVLLHLHRPAVWPFDAAVRAGGAAA